MVKTHEIRFLLNFFATRVTLLDMKNIFLKSLVFCLALTHLACAMQPHEVFIIIPGTWALKEKWFKIGGDFFTALQESVAYKNAKVLWFRWLTNNYESSRKEAARELAHILTCFEVKTEINLIAHSHGVNVALGACALLARDGAKRKIKTLYALGAPIYEETYCPQMDVIMALYNLYSLNDTIQTIWGYKRIFAKQPGIVNLRVTTDGKEPTHFGMHSATIGKWLVALPHLYCADPGIIKFFEKKPPKFENDPDCQKLLADEKPIDFETLLYIRKKYIIF